MDETQPPVVAMAEIGEMLGVSKRRVSMLIARDDFPQPIAVLSVSRVWSYDQVKDWAEAGGRVISPIAPR
jgi:predicted DNA-binding transcriptional regulator AlpA